MGRGKILNEYEKGQINAFKALGLSGREIAKKINRSRSIVQHYINDEQNYGTKKSPGRPCFFSKRAERNLIRLVHKGKFNASEIASKITPSPSTKTIRRVLNRSGLLQYSKIKAVPKLKKHHKENRLKFAEKHLCDSTNWDNIIFSDEKKFNLDGPDGIHYYWRDLRREQEYISKRQQGGGSVLVWGAFSSKGVINLAFLVGRQDSLKYQETLQNYLLPEAMNITSQDFIFQQDNATIHVSNSTKSWFLRNNVKLLEWPACSPDINPIENLWGILVRKIYKHEGQIIQFSSLTQLKNAIEEAWNGLEPSILKNLVKSMPKRCLDIVKNKGGHINY
jgi:transposase